MDMVMQRFRRFAIRFLGSMARSYMIKHRPYVIGISGSVGKSSCRMIVSHICSHLLPGQYAVWTPQSNYNGEIGFSLSIFGIDSFSNTYGGYCMLLIRLIKAYVSSCPYRVMCLEYGVDTPGEMDFLLSIVKPTIGIFTQSDSVHSEQFGNPQRIASDDMKMIYATKNAVFLSMDDTYAKQAVSRIKCDVFRYKMTGSDNSVDIVYDCTWDDYSLQCDDNGIPYARARICVKNLSYTVSVNLLGKQTMAYVSLGLACADLLMYFFEKKIITEPNADYYFHCVNLPSRLSLFSGKYQSLILDGSYNASPHSVRSLLDTAYYLRSQCYPHYRILVVLGDMRELGSFAQAEHRKVAAPISMVADKVVLVGTDTERYTRDELIKIGYPLGSVFHYPTSILACSFLVSLLSQDSDQRLIVVKGSQNTIFLEELVVGLLANPLDATLVCRQSSTWIARKKRLGFIL